MIVGYVEHATRYTSLNTVSWHLKALKKAQLSPLTLSSWHSIC